MKGKDSLREMGKHTNQEKRTSWILYSPDRDLRTFFRAPCGPRRIFFTSFRLTTRGYSEKNLEPLGARDRVVRSLSGTQNRVG